MKPSDVYKGFGQEKVMKFLEERRLRPVAFRDVEQGERYLIASENWLTRKDAPYTGATPATANANYVIPIGPRLILGDIYE